MQDLHHKKIKTEPVKIVPLFNASLISTLWRLHSPSIENNRIFLFLFLVLPTETRFLSSFILVNLINN